MCNHEQTLKNIPVLGEIAIWNIDQYINKILKVVLCKLC